MPDSPPPICACCGREIGGMWSVTAGLAVYVICGDGSCEGWARSQGLSIHTTGVMGTVRGPRRPPKRKRQKPGCATCGKELSGRKRERFRIDDREFCTLTCVQRREKLSDPPVTLRP